MNDSALAFFRDLEPAVEDFRESVLSGLGGTPRRLSCKFFYDERGSDLFNRICETDEYYVTRTETALLRRIGPEVAALTGTGAVVVEYGSGSSEKIRLLLGALERPAAYVPIDISRDHLRRQSGMIALDYPETRVGAICADFTQDIRLPADVADLSGRRLAFFPGSTIGNFGPKAAAAFLQRIRRLVGTGGALLIGVDVKKDPARLNAAYNDAAGLNAAFNLNLLHRMQRELDAEVDPDAFAHVAFYDEDAGRIELHLESLRDQTIRVGGHDFPLKAGERIHTEDSYKYAIEEFAALAAGAGFAPARSWTDDDRLFSIHYLDAVD